MTFINKANLMTISRRAISASFFISKGLPKLVVFGMGSKF
jgi:hypothetical protein